MTKTSSKNNNYLQIKGATENNLKNISLNIEHDKLTVVTGLSGSGKSSLAFSTVYAEGQRRYIETFNPYTRQFLDKVKKPAALSIDNVRPAIAIQQRTRITSSRSSVGSMTGITDLIKILYANLSQPYVPDTDIPLVCYSADQVANLLITWSNQFTNKTLDQTILIIAPIQLPEKPKARKQEIERLTLLGYSRYLNNNIEIEKLENITDYSKISGTFPIIIARLRSTNLTLNECREAAQTAYSLTRGTLQILFSDKKNNNELAMFPKANGNIVTLSEYYRLPSGSNLNEDTVIPDRTAALFDPNSAKGACTVCTGFGYLLVFDEDKIVQSPNLSLRDGAIHPWKNSSDPTLMQRLIRFAKAYDIPVNLPWNLLKTEHRQTILNQNEKGYSGVIPWFKKLERKRHKMHIRVLLSRYRSQAICPSCNGKKIRQEALYFKLAGLSIDQVMESPIDKLLEWSKVINQITNNSNSESKDLTQVIRQLTKRLTYLVELGMPYLNLNRAARTLSGGETQRVNLTTALGSDLISTHFVLDEPSVGLHPRDTNRLIKSIRSLQSVGNSVLVVEHDLDCINSADNIIELGPEAGNNGGQIVYSGIIDDWQGIGVAKIRHTPRLLNDKFNKQLVLKDLSARNLKSITTTFPVGLFTTLTGVSGSGKSTLIEEELLTRWGLYKRGLKDDLTAGFENFKEVVSVDQSSLVKSPRANIATYCGLWDTFRNQLAAQTDAELRSLTKSSFSFNVDGGRCPICQGAGYLREDMQFLSDVYVLCEECLGKRFQNKVLEVRYLGKNAAEWLETTVSDLPKLLPADKKLNSAVDKLIRLGLGHLRLGHPLSELSGGEAQRLKLIPYLEQAGSDPSLLIFDEPTTGLHLKDVLNLIQLFKDLTLSGHTVICIEHNLELISASDWIIDLGPEGGEKGGELIFSGTPTSMLKEPIQKISETARYLAQYIDIKQTKSSNKNLTTKTKSSAKEISKDSEILNQLKIVGAREHNLKNISLEIPHDQIIAITGVSGSGKSTLAKDIIYSEGQRRYLDCLSPYARQFIRELSKPDIDSITGIRPTICVHQHTFKPNSLSTIATMSEVYNFLRLLYSKAGTQYCPDHPDKKVEALSAESIAHLIAEHNGKKVRILAPVIKGRKGIHKDIFARALKSEILEVRVNGTYHQTGTLLSGLDKNKKHDIEYVWATVVPGRVPFSLLVNAIEEAFAISAGTVIINVDGKDLILSRERACPVCRRGFFRPDPEDLSFSSRRGRCTRCEGQGVVGKKVCPACLGSRISQVGSSVKIEHTNIYQATLMTPPELTKFLSTINWETRLRDITEPVISELNSRLDVLTRIGLNYLPLARSCFQLSAGELQRLKLATAIGSPLSGSLYIFDEPSAGLHPLDNKMVIGEFESLKNYQNTVLLIEHDQQTIQAADTVLEIGPGGGSNGGEVVFFDSISRYKERSLNSGHVHSKSSKDFKNTDHRNTESKNFSKKIGNIDLEVNNLNNIKHLTTEIPLYQLVSIIGVSGAGKSTMINQGLLPLVMDLCEEGKLEGSNSHAKIKLSEEITRVIVVDQSPIGRNSRSTPASYLKIWDHVRTLFASTVEARTRGWNSSYFSYNSGLGRCKECKGLGEIELEMSFLSEAHITCESCRGARFSDEALSIRYLGKTVAEILSMTFEEAKEIFNHHKKIHRLLHTACDLGLGYLTLGQSSNTLSGGECQRIKLVVELARPNNGHTLYVLDEPTVGLHRSDVAKLVNVLHSLVALENSVLVIEHDQDLILESDHLIELGPKAGDEGGKIVFNGSPKQLNKAKSAWGEVLRDLIVLFRNVCRNEM